MTTETSAAALMQQAEALRAAAEALSPKLGDASIAKKDREKLFEQFQALHAQAFALSSKAAENIVINIGVDVASLQATIDKGVAVLGTIQKVKDVIKIATAIVQTGAAVATGQPAAIATALTGLQTQLDKVRK